MLMVETKAKIRHRYHVKKESVSVIARTMGLSRNTVRKVVNQGNLSDKYTREVQPAPKLGEYKTVLLTWLNEDKGYPLSSRCSARKMHERLQAAGYEGCYDNVQRFMRHWKLTEGDKLDAYIPLYFAKGEAYQFDWSEETVELGGVVQKVQVAQFRLCYSRYSFIVAYPRQSQEMLFDAHAKAFEFFGGVTARGIYDNMKTAVDLIFVGKERQFNARFLHMMNHYLIDPTACTPAAGWEKGQIENQVNTNRKQLFTPRRKAVDLETLNQGLAVACEELARNRAHPEQKEKTVFEVFEGEEKPALREMMRAFKGYSERVGKMSSTCLVQYDRNRYSADCRYANRSVSIRAYAAWIEIVADGKVIGKHPRLFGRDKTQFDPLHYLPVLERKPGALRNGAPFVDWMLPDSLNAVKTALLKRKGGDKECVKILSAMLIYGQEAVGVACEMALNDKILQADYVLNLLTRLTPTASPEEIKTPQALVLQCEPLSHCHRYDALLQGEISYVNH